MTPWPLLSILIKSLFNIFIYLERIYAGNDNLNMKQDSLNVVEDTPEEVDTQGNSKQPSRNLDDYIEEMSKERSKDTAPRIPNLKESKKNVLV